LHSDICFTGRTRSVVERVADAADTSRIFWRIDDITATSVFDARGNLLRSNLGNGMGTAHAFDALSGKAFELRAGVAAGGYTNALSHKQPPVSTSSRRCQVFLLSKCCLSSNNTTAAADDW
jgi:hypothetical protein